MPKLILEVDVPDVDPTLEDPEQVAEDVLSDDRLDVEIISAEWA